MAITKIQSNAFPASIDLSNIDLTLGANEVLTANIADSNITTAKIADGAVHTDKVADLAVTHAKLHTDMDLSGKTVTLPTIQHSLSIDDSSAVDNSWNTLAQFHPSVSDGPAEAGIRIQSYPSTTSVPARMAGIQSQSNTGVALPLLLNKDGGNVGIGTTTPSEYLELARTAGKIGFGMNGEYGVRIGYFDDGGGTHGFHVDTKHTGTVTSESRFVVRADSGNVGIGTKGPSTKLEVDGAVKVKAGASDTGGIRLHTNSGINASANVMSFHTGQVDGFKFNINSDGADNNNTVVSITTGGNIVQQASYSNSRAIPEVYELEPYTINVGGYKRSWVKLFQFSTGGQQECQFRMHFQGDHNYNHLFMCQGQVHQWSASTGNVNFYIKGIGGNLTGNFVFTSDHSCWWKPSGLWSDTGRFEVLSKTSGCTIMTDPNNNLADGSDPSGTVYSFSNTGETSGEINWGQ